MLCVAPQVALNFIERQKRVPSHYSLTSKNLRWDFYTDSTHMWLCYLEEVEPKKLKLAEFVACLPSGKDEWADSIADMLAIEFKPPVKSHEPPSAVHGRPALAVLTNQTPTTTAAAPEPKIFAKLARTSDLHEVLPGAQDLLDCIRDTRDPASNQLSCPDTSRVADLCFTTVMGKFGDTRCCKFLFEQIAQHLRDYFPYPRTMGKSQGWPTILRNRWRNGVRTKVTTEPQTVCLSRLCLHLLILKGRHHRTQNPCTRTRAS